MNTIKKTSKKQSEKILESVSSLTPKTVIEQVGAFQADIQSMLSDLSSSLSSKIEQMNNIEEAIALKMQQLKDLHSIESDLVSLESIKELCEKEKHDLQKSVIEQKIMWEDDEKERSKRWKREEEEHAYAEEQKKKRFQQEYAEEVAKNRRSESMRQEDLEKQWKSRENSIASQEKDIADLKVQVSQFDSKLKSEYSKAEAITSERLKKEYEHQILLLKKDMEAEKQLNSIKTSAMEDTIENLEKQISDLLTQLNAARADAREITNTALQSASGREAMNALQKANESTANKTK